MKIPEEGWPEPGQPGLGGQDGADADALERGGRLKKAPTAFRTISEVADDLHVPQHVLRFWETRFPQVKPLKRGGGRRYYRPDDVVLLRRIADLLYIQGYTIKGVQRLLLEGNGTLAGDLPPPDVADRDDGIVSLPPPPGSGSGHVADDDVRLDEMPAEAVGSGSGPGVHDLQALRETLHEILTGLEAMRRRLA